MGNTLPVAWRMTVVVLIATFRFSYWSISQARIFVFRKHDADFVHCEIAGKCSRGHKKSKLSFACTQIVSIQQSHTVGIFHTRHIQKWQ